MCGNVCGGIFGRFARNFTNLFQIKQITNRKNLPSSAESVIFITFSAPEMWETSHFRHLNSLFNIISNTLAD